MSINSNHNTSTSFNQTNSVVLDNVDDYLAPSQACINPLFQPSHEKNEKPQETAPTDTLESVVVPRRRRRNRVQQALTEESQNHTASPSKIAQEENKKKDDVIKAAMADCLACSGCVTTAETVLMEQQHSLRTLKECLRSTPDGGPLIGRVITLSPNSWAELCRYWQLNDTEDQYFYYARFTTLLCQILSAHVVVDGNVPLQWTWMGEAEEFCQAYKRSKKENGKKADLSKLFPSIAIDSTKTQIYQSDGTTKIEKSVTGEHHTPFMPLISGSCPALVCLVEKTLTALVPHLSQVISPMSMVGMVLKTQHTSSLKWEHWAIMPCHDKKLEASRKDFYLGDTKEQIVNLVISTKECVELVEEWLASKHNQENKVDISAFLESLPASGISTNILQPKDLFPTASQAVTSNAPLLIASKLQNFLQERNFHQPVTEKKQMTFASGGHADYIFHYAARKLFDCHLDESDEIWKATSLVTKMVKSARLKQQRKLHYYEAKLFQQPDGSYSCKESEDPPVLHFAIAHGMQTMQRALKSIQSSISDLHYLEAMACPHGCVNGGGSAGLRTDGKNSSSSTISVIRETPSETQSRVKDTLTHLHISAPVMPLPDEDLEAFRTRYHVVPPMQYTMGATAGVQVDKIQW